MHEDETAGRPETKSQPGGKKERLYEAYKSSYRTSRHPSSRRF